MMKSMGLSVAYIIGLGIISQLSSIVSIKLWGRYSDRFSNKNIIAICAPLYIACILAFAFAAMPGNIHATLSLLVVIHIISGLSTAGINLSLSNIGIKLAPNDEAIAYITAKNMFVALFSTLAPMVGGLMADFFVNHQLDWSVQLKSAGAVSNLHLLTLQGWNYFFVIGGLLSLVSLRLLTKVKEEGEIDKRRMVIHMHANLREKLRTNLGRKVTNKLYFPAAMTKRKKVRRLKFEEKHRRSA
jgi:MFS family permease